MDQLGVDGRIEDFLVAQHGQGMHRESLGLYMDFQPSLVSERFGYAHNVLLSVCGRSRARIGDQKITQAGWAAYEPAAVPP